MICEAVARDLQTNQRWTREFIDALTPYYVATLTHMNKGNVTPVFQVIDEIWHAHILCTRDYADFCTRQFGAFIHHERTDGVPADTSADFLLEYGLSEADLRSICEAHAPELTTMWAACGSGAPPRLTPDVDASAKTDPLPVATCGVGNPVPPVERHTPLNLAACGTSQPKTLPHTGSGALANRLAVATCTQPDQEPPLPQALAHALSVATCGPPFDDPPSPPRWSQARHAVP
jgi:hypothetical protein